MILKKIALPLATGLLFGLACFSFWYASHQSVGPSPSMSLSSKEGLAQEEIKTITPAMSQSEELSDSQASITEIPAISHDLPRKQQLAPQPKGSTTQEPETKKYDHTEYLWGFKTTQAQEQPIDLTITGSIPEWLSGTFLAIGPGQFETQGKKAEYWLDGFGMIHQFILTPHSGTYKNTLIQGEYYKRTCATGIFGSKPTEKKSKWAKLKGALSSGQERPKYDNANINLLMMNDALVACTETPHATGIDYTTLHQCGACTHQDSLEGHFTTAHPLYDRHTKEWFNIMINFAHNSTYTIYHVKEGSSHRIPLITLPAPYPSYIHSFALTKDYVLLIEVPFTVSPYDLLLSDSGFIDNFTWKPKNGTKISVVSRKSKKLIGVYSAPAFFALHHLNAYQQDDTVLLDSAVYPDPSVIKSFYLEQIANDPTHIFPQAYLTRFTIDLATKKISKKELSSSSIEFPQINKEYAQKAHRFVYGTTSTNKRVAADGIIKIDTKNEKEIVWREQSCFPCEPLFVPAPNAKAEDDGVILSLVLDGKKRQSFVLILNAKDLTELGRAITPHPISYTVHSLYINGSSTQKSPTQPRKKHHLFEPFRQKRDVLNH